MAYTKDRWLAARVAVIATCALDDVLATDVIGTYELETIVRACDAFRPSWLPKVGEALMEQSPRGYYAVRALMTAGLIERPTTPLFALGLVTRHWLVPNGETLRATVARDPVMLDLLWTLFEVEGSGEFSLAAYDKYNRDELRWEVTLVALARDGVLSRPRLLEASLAALERGFGQFRAGWFSRFHETLEPTVDERVLLQERYLRLLASPIPPTVAMALGALRALQKARRLDAEAIGKSIEPALRARAKKTAVDALALVRAVADADPQDAVRLALVALRHEAAEVQASALDLLETVVRPDDVATHREIASSADAIAATLRPRLARWGAAASEVVVDTLPADDALPVPTAVTPISTLDALIDRFAYVLEHDDDPLEIERVLGAFGAIAFDASDWLAKSGPLRKRAKALFEKPTFESPIRWHLARLALSIAGPLVDVGHPPIARSKSVPDLFADRIDEVHARSERPGEGGALSMPTHDDFSIEPRTLVERLVVDDAKGRTFARVDGSLALLRLAESHRAEALVTAAGLRGEVGRAVRYALGGAESIGPTAWLWVAAGRARTPHGDDADVDRAHPGLGPDAATLARRTWQVTSFTSGPYLHHTLEITLTNAAKEPAPRTFVSTAFVDGRRHGLHSVALIRWASTLWPAGASFFAVGTSAIGNNLDWWEAQWANRAFLEPLLRPSCRMMEMHWLLLALALAAKEPGESGLATDVLLATIADGRFDAVALGACAARLLGSGLVKAARWAATFAVAAQANTKARAAVRAFVEKTLAGDPTTAPRDVATLLEWLVEDVAASGERLADAGAIAYVRGLAGGGKVARLRKALLAGGG
ncbi:MAG: DUF6493 family protein [Polyangiales bacterium]